MFKKSWKIYVYSYLFPLNLKEIQVRAYFLFAVFIQLIRSEYIWNMSVHTLCVQTQMKNVFEPEADLK